MVGANSTYEIHVFIGCALAAGEEAQDKRVGAWQPLMVFSRQYRLCGYHDYSRMERVAREHGWGEVLVARDGVLIEGQLHQARPAVRDAFERALTTGGSVLVYTEWEGSGLPLSQG
ncbi:hypothetical protein B5T_00869 [Alloalcanivorax dieselolei B5]|uniref:Uncharacterized protein n=1 Tax=Alcanivorax dieselolei (strain DSM 16502 / CGMCC 1.3690 / MCCC 1A00001 / B-5) TaxID=930169 RepID=K0C999_ALCDB|nr:hypothetical protein [Alloalcanivorax dieselolei]AFT69153.1 hypothetical protein B5T_00869 [Alloalcanivorax dieselolei B5]GGJ82932.1 hypothetical protein GCM10007426_10030 [Alloalcanivorax dieselolei]